MKKLFGGLKMKWPAVLLFAVITGVYTGMVMLIPKLEGTSFQDIGTYIEWWIVFAVIIVVNCSKNWEAALKCFVFFLISQPLVYLTQIVFGNLSIDMAINYYFHGLWFPMTVATLPGGFIAWYCKKQNLFGCLVLAVANTMLLAMGVYYVSQAAERFPHHVLSAIVCFFAAEIMTVSIQKKKKYRIIAFAVPVALVAALAVFCKVTGRTLI